MNLVTENRSDIAAAILMERIFRDIYQEKSSREIQPLQWSILRYLSNAPKNRRTMSSIRDFLGVTHAPVVRALGTLGKRGFLVQDQNPDDARSKLVSLTPKGIAILRADPILKVVKLLSVLPEIEREQFKRTVRSMAMNMGSSDILDDEKNTTD